MEKFAVAGTPAEARAQLERLAGSGLVDEIALIPHTPNPAERHAPGESGANSPVAWTPVESAS